MTEVARRQDEDKQVLPAGQAVVVAVRERLNGCAVPRNHLAIIGRHGRSLLEDGFDFETVVTAGLLALRRCEPYVMCYIANDLQQAQMGTKISRRAYTKALEDEMELSHGRTGRAGDHPHG